MRLFIWAFVLLLLLAVAAGVLFISLESGTEGEEMQRHHNPTGGFSFVPPQGWTMMQAPGDQYASCHGPSTGDFVPSIGVSDTTDFRAEPCEGSLKEYVALTKEQLARNGRGAQPDQTVFVTDSGMEGIRLTYEMSHTAGKLRAWQFFFEGRNDRKIVVTCYALAESEADFEAVFDGVLKTFRVER